MSEWVATTRGVRVQVTPRYSPEHSDPAKGRWFWLYTIRIANLGEQTVQLMTRHWIIRDANGEVEEVRGPGVVGQQPVLESGDAFEYTSGCPLKTPFGSMEGTYQLRGTDGLEFDVVIPAFSLSQPGAVN